MKSLNKLYIVFIILLLFGCNKKEYKDIEFSLPPGTYDSEISFFIKNKNNNTILFTTDGSDPKKNILSVSTKVYEDDGTPEPTKVSMGNQIILKYILYQRGYKTSEIKTAIWKVREKLDPPNINIIKNQINFIQNSDIFYSINGNSDFIKYSKPFSLENGKYSIKYYSKKKDYINSDIIEKNIKIDIKTLEAPILNIDRNIITFETKTPKAEIYYSINNNSYKKYFNKITLNKGIFSLKYYSQKEDSLNSKIIKKELNITKIKKNIYSFSSNINLNEDSTFFSYKDSTFVIEKNKILKISNNLKTKELNLSNSESFELKNYSINKNKILFLFYNSNLDNSFIVETDIYLNKLYEFTLKEEYSFISYFNNYKYLFNNKKVLVLDENNQKSITKLNFQKNNINKIKKVVINDINSFFFITERINEYNSIEPFIFNYNNTITPIDFVLTGNNEYFLESFNNKFISIEDREIVNFYNLSNNKKLKYKFSNNYNTQEKITIKNIQNINKELIIIGEFLNSDFPFILILKNDNWKKKNIYNFKFSVKNVSKKRDEYIIEGIKDNNYFKLIINEMIINQNN